MFYIIVTTNYSTIYVRSRHAPHDKIRPIWQREAMQRFLTQRPEAT